jgi:hypothetical protein
VFTAYARGWISVDERSTKALYKNNTLTVVSLSSAGKVQWSTNLLRNHPYLERLAAGDLQVLWRLV